MASSKLVYHVDRAWHYFSLGRHRQAIKHAIKAEKINTNLPETFYVRGLSLLFLGDQKTCRQILEDGLKKFPDHPDLLSALGGLLVTSREFVKAEQVLEKAIEIKPEQALAWTNFSYLKVVQSDHLGANSAAKRALELCPNDTGALQNLAVSYKELGYTEESIKTLRDLTSRFPGYRGGWTTLLFSELFDENVCRGQLLLDAKRCANAFRSIKVKKQALNPPVVGKIRIGLMSNDLFSHSAAYFLIPFISNLDRSLFHVTLFSLNNATDNVTVKYRLLADEFVSIFDLFDQEVVKTVVDRDIDVLVDMGGYTGISPLQFMVHRLARIQMTWFGYPGTSGMEEIDFRLSDIYSDPKGQSQFYVEKLLRSNGVFCPYYPLVKDPLNVYSPKYAITELPAVKKGFITFGSCNNLAKLTDKTLKLWAKVLDAVEGSRLLVEAAGIDLDFVKNNILERMVRNGLLPEKVIFLPRLHSNQYLTYNNIDIVLDTTPLAGGTTTCDALWMGVPVVTLAMESFHTRISLSFFNALGLNDLVTSTPDEYVNCAVALAENIPALAELRQNLRPRFETSAAQDAKGFCQWFADEMLREVGKFKQVIPDELMTGEGIFFGGGWHPMLNIQLSIVQLFKDGQFVDLRHLLENLSSKWSKHWMVAFVLSEMEYCAGRKMFSLSLLVESFNLKPKSFALARLILARSIELGTDTAPLETYVENKLLLTWNGFKDFPIPSFEDVIFMDRQ